MIHFSLTQSEGKPFIGMIAHLRRYLENIHINEDIEYKIFTFNSNRNKNNRDSKVSRIGEYIYGKTALDIASMRELAILLNNHYNNKPLLEGIDMPDTHRQMANDIIKYYTENAARLDIVMFSVFEPLLFHNLLAALVIKRINPIAKTVFGGVHIQTSKNLPEFLCRIEEVDHVIVGDLSAGTEDLLNDKVGKSIYYTLDKDLDLLHPAIYYPEDIELIKRYSTHELPGTWINGVRGCPNRCSFCLTSAVKFRVASVEAVAESIKDIHKICPPELKIHLSDNTCNYSKQRIHDLTDIVIANNNKMQIQAFMVFDNLDKDIIRKLKAAKFEHLLLGYNGQINLLKDLTFNEIHAILFNVFCEPKETIEAFNSAIKEVIKVQQETKWTYMMLYTYDHLAGSIDFDRMEHTYWEPQLFLEKNDEMNEIVTRTPRHYHRDLYSQAEYDRRRAKVLELMKFYL